MDICFEALETAGGEQEGSLRKSYAIGLDLIKINKNNKHLLQEKGSRQLDPLQSSYDVADRNMALVLGKSGTSIGHWQPEVETNGQGHAEEEELLSEEEKAYSHAAFFVERPFRKAVDLTEGKGKEKEADLEGLKAQNANNNKKALASNLESTLRSMQFSSAEVLFDLD